MMDGLMLYMTCGMFDMGSEYGILEGGSGASKVLLERLDIPVHLEEESSTARSILYAICDTRMPTLTLRLDLSIDLTCRSRDFVVWIQFNTAKADL